MSNRSLPFWLVAAGVAVGQRPGLGGPLPLRWQRRWLDTVAGLMPNPSGTVLRQIELGGRPALRVSVGATERPRAVLHLHGGAYTVGSPRSHRGLAALLAAASGSVVYLPDYRLAPEHPFPAALEDAVLAAEELAGQYPRFAISGDSAGGGLAVATARRLTDAGTARPAALALISPWVDPAAPITGRRRDLVVREKWGRICATHYLGAGDLTDAGFAPGRGRLDGLPPTIVHIGKREVLHPQVVEFAANLRAAGVEVRLTELPRLWHVGHVSAGVLPESREAVEELGNFLRHRLDLPAVV
ncbi:MAG: alpha/beta hydrolase [Jatrophihabitantaceae bacterium]